MIRHVRGVLSTYRSDAITSIVLLPDMVYANLWALRHSYSFCSVNDNREMEELLDKMHSLSVHEQAYVHLYTQCFCHFPEFAKELLKPEIISAAPSATFAYQALTTLVTTFPPC